MTKSLPTHELAAAGQSPWLDNLSRELLTTGKLKSLIEESGLLGVTSNPSIFDKAISTPGGGYDTAIRKMIRQGKDTFEIYDALTMADIRQACDLFLPVYKQSGGEDGFVSLEVMPTLAYEEEASYEEASRLYHAVKRPNVMIKVPATPQGVRAIQRLIANGININVTLIFSLPQYQHVAHAYLAGLRDYASKGGNLSKVHSVASVFVSRVDTWVDKRLEELQKVASGEAQWQELENLKGKAAVANAKIIFQEFKKIFSSDSFQELRSQGACLQKLLWGSTSCKNPNYPDLIYVETLIGPNTINTMPDATLQALLDHGKIRPLSVAEDLEGAHHCVQSLKTFGIDLGEVGEILQQKGARAFCDSFESLMRHLELKRYPGKASSRSVKTFYGMNPSVEKEIQASEVVRSNVAQRLLVKDASLWSSDPETQKAILNRLGWLHSSEWILGKLYELDQLRKELRPQNFNDVVLLGMGGSSLAAEVMDRILRSPRKTPRFHVLDTTDPSSIRKVDRAINYKTTLFIVASKSGSTLETLSQYHYFFDQAEKKLGGKAASHFVAITDEGTPLERIAREKKFRRVFLNPSDIGGRYSALSYFGLVPAAMLGINVRPLVWEAYSYLTSFRVTADWKKDAGLSLGLLLGTLTQRGRDKLTLWLSPSVTPFGPWLEQLIAESTGKDGKGIIPVDGEREKAHYGSDRIFVVIKIRGERIGSLEHRVRALRKAGHPVVVIEWAQKNSLGAEFLRWEVAVAIAARVLQVNPFDEPNVKESKDKTSQILKHWEGSRVLKSPPGCLTLDADKSVFAQIARHLRGVRYPGYVAILAYLERCAEIEEMLRDLQQTVGDAVQVPVLLGFGPRYLHSIGQLYKGGPRIGRFLAFLSEPLHDLGIPGAPYTFGTLIKAQAFGDLEALQARGLPAIACHLGRHPLKGLKKFKEQIDPYLRNTE